MKRTKKESKMSGQNNDEPPRVSGKFWIGVLCAILIWVVGLIICILIDIF